MNHKSLLAYKKNLFSQNGEDGIIARIFEIIGTSSGSCCEFGAWDGIHLSNTRHLVLDGWTGIFLEADEVRFRGLQQNYRGNDKVFCINRYVDDSQNSLLRIAHEAGLTRLVTNLDFLSIDVDGLDYEIFDSLDVYPNVICVEVNAGYSPLTCTMMDRKLAKENVGQPLGCFTRSAERKGYRLVCYTGNAFYVRNDVDATHLPSVSDEKAYTDFLDHLSVEGLEWLLLVNLGMVPPFYKFSNPFLSHRRLGIKTSRTIWLFAGSWLRGNTTRRLSALANGWFG